MTELELIRDVAGSRLREVDLLLVHGICAGAWIWQEGSMIDVAQAGYRTWALSFLFDHSGDDAPWQILDRYTSDLDEALNQIGRPTVVIAHSLGGAVVQNLLRRGRDLEGTVLLCSVPPYGLWRASLEMLAFKPDLWQAVAFLSLFGLRSTDMNVLRRHLFPGGIDHATFARICARLKDESLFAMGSAMGWRPIAPLPLSHINVLVVGCTKDCLIPEIDVRLTAAYYNVQPHIIEGAGHMPMLEAAGKDASQIILHWLSGLPPSTARFRASSGVAEGLQLAKGREG